MPLRFEGARYAESPAAPLDAKGRGYFGVLRRPDGEVSTELSFDFNHQGKPVSAPLLVPTLSRQELDHLLSGADPTDSIYEKAQLWALHRLGRGLPPFATDTDMRHPLPPITPLEEIVK